MSGIPGAAAGRPPAWLVGATALLTAGVLAMAVAETSLWMHYLIDAGELISLGGLAFIAAAGAYLAFTQRLRAALPLTVPWLLFPVITQGDQIIDNLSIGWMRLVVHLLLALIFAGPVVIVVLAARYGLAPGAAGQGRRIPAWIGWAVPGVRQLADGQVRTGSAVLAAFLLTLETLVAVRFLGLLMVITLVAMIWAVLGYGFSPGRAPLAAVDRRARERRAGLFLAAGVLCSAGLFFGFKHRPGAYQGSPAAFMDPAQQDAAFRLDRIPVPSGPIESPPDPGAVSAALVAQARALQELLAGYYILDRNYNYDFHNRLFVRSTPLLPAYREAGLARVRQAMALAAAADAKYRSVRGSLTGQDPLAALMDDVRAYTAYSCARAPVLEKMSAGFEQTEAGLQHATHLYEGEGKMLGVQLNELLTKHRTVVAATATAAATSEFAAISREIYTAYENRIVGF